MSKTSKEKFQQIIKRYRLKYSLTKTNFMKFIKVKVQLSEQKYDEFEKIINIQIKQNQFDQNTLHKLFHLIAAFQAKKDLSNISQSQLQKFIKIKFITKQGKSVSQSNNAEIKTQIPQIKESGVEKQQQKTSKIKQQKKEQQQKKNNDQQNIQQQNQIQLSFIDKQLIDIRRFEKRGQDFLNPVIKYQLVYNNQYNTWRRYSEIQKLLNYLKNQYQGVILPQMPPKEGIKGNIIHLWKSGINEQFLQERRDKLKLLLNRILACKQVCENEVLQQFLKVEAFEVPSLNKNVQNSYLQTLVGIKDVVLNYNQLKGYGVAYYNYLIQSNNTLNTRCTQQFTKLQPIIDIIKTLNEHRIFINQNYQKRQQIRLGNQSKIKIRDTNLDKLLEKAQIQCEELKQQYGRYTQLKYSEGWEKQLIKQKQPEGGKSFEKLQKDYKETREKVGIVQKNLQASIKKFNEKSTNLFQALSKQLINWRKKFH